jgi:GNAT superfamily N-acetyltransferase
VTSIRLAQPQDLNAIVTTVATAFADDPAWLFMMGAGNEAGMRAFAKALAIPRIESQTLWVSDDLLAVSMWDRVNGQLGVITDEYWEQFRREVSDEVWHNVHTYETAIAVDAPTAPYWYLGVLATHPDAQGRGLATAVMQPGFAAAAADAWDCWLETSLPKNKPFYANRGFTEATGFDVPGGPPTWWIRRPHTA